jgi:hypothetical protein
MASGVSRFQMPDFSKLRGFSLVVPMRRLTVGGLASSGGLNQALGPQSSVCQGHGSINTAPVDFRWRSLLSSERRHPGSISKH